MSDPLLPILRPLWSREGEYACCGEPVSVRIEPTFFTSPLWRVELSDADDHRQAFLWARGDEDLDTFRARLTPEYIAEVVCDV